jgi:hypothetical protein
MTQIDTGELKAIALKNYNRIPSQRGDDPKAFFHTVLMWLADWCGAKRRRATISPGYCAFVLGPELLSGAPPVGAQETFFFKEDSTPLLSGNVYLSDYAMNRVLCFSGECKDLSDTVRMLIANNLSGFPFVAFDTDSQTVYVFTDGETEMTIKFVLDVDLPRPFTIDVFEEILEDIYVQSLKYPSGLPLWHDAEYRVPCKDTESVIQSHVAWILRAMAHGSNKATSSELDWLTVVENKNNAGRVDIVIYRDQQCIVVSELKVLRHCRYPDLARRKMKLADAKTQEEVEKAMRPTPVKDEVNERWAMHGARQAARYRTANGARSAALVLYDMRENDTDVPAVKVQCATDDVRYLRYYLHNELPAEV